MKHVLLINSELQSTREPLIMKCFGKLSTSECLLTAGNVVDVRHKSTCRGFDLRPGLPRPRTNASVPFRSSVFCYLSIVIVIILLLLLLLLLLLISENPVWPARWIVALGLMNLVAKQPGNGIQSSRDGRALARGGGAFQTAGGAYGRPLLMRESGVILITIP